MKTILITGCSSGFGLETARYFLERDWQVVATMRTPREDVLPASKNKTWGLRSSITRHSWRRARGAGAARVLRPPGLGSPGFRPATPLAR